MWELFTIYSLPPNLYFRNSSFWAWILFLRPLIGTFIFLSVILTTGEALPIGLALAVAIYFGGKVSGGNYNPAVSTMMYLKHKLDTSHYIGYVIAQILGGIAAYLFNQHVNLFIKKK